MNEPVQLYQITKLFNKTIPTIMQHVTFQIYIGRWMSQSAITAESLNSLEGNDTTRGSTHIFIPTLY